MPDKGQDGAAPPRGAAAQDDRNRGFPFRKPEKYKLGDDFPLFIRKMDLFFAAMEVKNKTRKRVSILLNMSEDSFRIAESVEF